MKKNIEAQYEKLSGKVESMIVNRDFKTLYKEVESLDKLERKMNKAK